MEKVLVQLIIPAIDEEFDVFLPQDIYISELAPVIANGVSELTAGKYSFSGSEMLCTREPLMVLAPKYSLQDYGLNDGSQLYLI